MAKEIRLPQLGQTMEEGTVVSCRVNVGDRVGKGDVIFEVETDKASIEMESPAEGFVKHIFAEAGRTLLVGEPMLVLGDKDEQLSQSFLDSLGGPVPAVQPQPQPSAAVTEQPQAGPPEPAGKVIASPKAKTLARQLGVDLARVPGTGPGRRITEQDVRDAAAQPAAALKPAVPELGATIPLNKLQRITAEKMLRSKREIPCFYLTVKADVTELVQSRNRSNRAGNVKISYNDFIMRAVALALKKFPVMTGQLDGDTIKLADRIGIGLAIAVPDGLVAPVVKDVDKKDLTAVARESTALIERARSGSLLPEDLEFGCITVSNLGALGVESFIPIVVPGQCSILGIGQIIDTCTPGGAQPAGNIAVRKLMSMTLSVDHKVTNGAYAAQFLDFVRKLLEQPSELT